MRLFILILLVCFCSFSCEEQFGFDDNEVPQKIVDNSIQLFQGTVLEKTSSILGGTQVWKVKIENNSGAIISFYWQKSYTILFQVEGEEGPFNYELDPPLNVIMLSTAKFLGFESYSSEVLISWKLTRDNSQKNKWVYQFFLTGNDQPITVNASSGDLL